MTDESDVWAAQAARHILGERMLNGVSSCFAWTSTGCFEPISGRQLRAKVRHANIAQFYQTAIAHTTFSRREIGYYVEEHLGSHYRTFEMVISTVGTST